MVGNKKLIYKPPPAQDYSSNFCKLYIVIAISFVFIAGEFVGGYISGSIAVISDAFHLVTDLIGFGISFFFIYFSRKEPTEKMSFGFHRLEIIGALGNLFIIWFLAIFMIYQATDRVIHKQFVAEPVAMLIVGVAGLAINIVMYFVLHTGSHSHGLMSEACDHHHQPHDNDPNPSNCTTSFCNELLCDDEDCLKQINYSHCHPKNQIGNQQVHIHDPKRKISDDLDGKEQGGENSMMQLGKDTKGKDCSSGCKQDHEHEYHKQNEHLHEHGHDHSDNHQAPAHKNGENRRHQNIIPSNVAIEIKTSNKPKRQSHSHELKPLQKSAKPQNEHKHSQNCKHGHDHKHDHKHQNQHDHHGHSHQGHNHQGHNHGDQNQSIGMKAAILHAFCNFFFISADVIQSIGLLISSLFIFFLGSDKGARVEEWNDWHYFDPISTYIFSVIVIISTFPIVKNCYYIIMEATPSTDMARQIKKEFEETPGVIDVHDLHIWSLRPGKNLLIAHVFAKDGAEREVLTSLTEICRRKKIFHSTLQVQEENWKNHEEYILCDQDIH